MCEMKKKIFLVLAEAILVLKKKKSLCMCGAATLRVIEVQLYVVKVKKTSDA